MLRRLLLALFGASCGLVGAVFVAEVYHQFFVRPQLEWHDPNTQFDSHLAWRPVSGRSISHAWGQISANAEGFRSPPLDTHRQQILLLGDSVAWGFGVGDSQSLGFLLEDELRPRNLQLTNLAVSGYGIDQYYLRLKEYLSHFSTQVAAIVVIICSKNDFNDTTSNYTSGKRKMLYQPHDADITLTNHPIDRLSRRNLLSESFVISSLSAALPAFGRLVGWMAGDVRLERPAGRSVIIRLLQRIQQEAASLGAPLVVLLSPDEERDFPIPAERYETFRSILEEAKIPFIDYQRYLTEKKIPITEIYFDRWHYNPQGNEILGKRILTELSTIGVFDPGIEQPTH